MPGTIVLLASGTRGDVQPFVALALGLQAAGCQVRVVTHPGFRSLVESRGLPYAALESNPSELLMQPEWESALVFERGWGRGVLASLRFMRAARPLYERMLASAWQACQGAGAVIVGLPTLWGEHIAEALEVPCLYCLLQPFSRTAAFPSALSPLRSSLGPVFNRLSHRVMEQALWQPWRATINAWRAGLLGLPKAPLAGTYTRNDHQNRPFIYGFSPRVVPRPADWPPWHQMTGYWFLEETQGWTPPQALERFLQAGEAPVYVGFGSSGTRLSPKMNALIRGALGKAGLRAVLASQEEVEQETADQFFYVRQVSHAWLFPRLAALVHHGGAGTTAAGLRAGVPALLMPQYADQFFWGERLAKLGLGPPPIPPRLLSPEGFLKALEQVVHNGGMRARARVIQGEILAEDGLERAVEIIRQAV